MKKNAILNLVALGLVGSTVSVAVAENAPTDVASSTAGVTLTQTETRGGGPVQGQPFTVNVWGATLMQNVVGNVSSCRDYLDFDGDGRYLKQEVANPTPAIDELGDDLPANPYLAESWWIVQYRAVGSVNGLQELVDFGAACLTTADTGIQPQGGLPAVQNTATTMSSDPASPALVNGTRYINAGDRDGASIYFIASNPGALTVRSYCTGTVPVGKQVYSAVPFLPSGQAGGARSDIAPIDVPVYFGLTVPGAPSANLTPGSPGYGTNPRLNRTKTGAIFTDINANTFGFRLVTLSAPYRVSYQIQPGDPAPDGFTIYETPLAYAPVAFITNLGVGRQTIRTTELRHLFTTGRMPNGENLMAVTRDTGSGTLNAASTSICIDPSHLVGEAIGGLSTAAGESNLGAGWQPGNKGSSGSLESTAQNHRLAITFTGAERGLSAPANNGWLIQGRMECLGVIDDFRGGTAAARPSIANVLGFSTIDFTPDVNGNYDHVALVNRYDGYNIGGFGVLASLGDPRSSLNDDANGVDIKGTDVSNTNPALRNPQAAAYVNNITRSIDDIVNFGPLVGLFSPGAVVANTLVLNQARAYNLDVLNPCTYLNNAFVGGLVADTATNNSLSASIYNTFGVTSFNGRTPTRTTLTGLSLYSDARGSANLNFIRQDGTTIGYNNAGAGTNQQNGVGARNRVAGDFNGDALRDLNDATEMVRAWWDRANRPASYVNNDQWQGGLVGNATFGDRTTNWIAPNGTGAIAGALGSTAIIEILGDFNGDGSFGRTWNGAAFVNDFQDLRYWADGLAIDPATTRLDRMKGFMSVDQALTTVASLNNVWGIVKATGQAYNAGDAAADVSGPSRLATPGYTPVGFDGRIDALDIDYVYAQFKRNPNVVDNNLNWVNLDEAGYALGVGIDGIANTADDEIVGNLSCDLTGDLVVDQADITKLFTILGTTSCDVNLDGVVSTLDRDIIVANLGPNPLVGTRGGFASGDVNGDGFVNQLDLDTCFPVTFSCCPGDANGNLAVNFADITSVLNNFNTVYGYAPNAGQGAGDSNCSAIVNFADITSTLNNFNTTCN